MAVGQTAESALHFWATYAKDCLNIGYMANIHLDKRGTQRWREGENMIIVVELYHSTGNLYDCVKALMSKISLFSAPLDSLRDRMFPI